MVIGTVSLLLLSRAGGPGRDLGNAMHMYTYIHIHIYIYIYIYNIPPLNNKPLIKKQNFGGISLFTINLDGGTITPLINDDVWFDLPPSSLTPPN